MNAAHLDGVQEIQRREQGRKGLVHVYDAAAGRLVILDRDTDGH